MQTQLFPALPKDDSKRHLNPARIVILTAVVLAIAGLPMAFSQPLGQLSLFYFINQDGFLILVISLALRVVFAAPDATPMASRGGFTVSPYAPFIAAAALVVICYAGHYLLLGQYHLTRDEQMAVFDAQIFMEGRLVAPLPEFWRPLADALNLMFMLPIDGNQAWISTYLPLNAAARAAVDSVSDPAILNPLLVAAGAVLLWMTVRKLWPEDRVAALAALLLYAGSGQIVLTGMTAYAMSAHLTLNLLWLWLFLQRRPVTDLLVVCVGFLATGIHQPIFHPLFAFPLLASLVFAREWFRAAFFLVGYLLIAAFWLNWLGFVADVAGGVPAEQSVSFFSRLMAELSNFSLHSFELMLVNLIRFFSWQHVVLLPLLLLGFRAAWRGGLFEKALMGSVLMPIVFMLIVFPYQGHGWGYRYEHAVLGPVILLALYGWRTIAYSGDTARRVLIASSVFTFVVLMPIQGWMMRSFYAAYGEVDASIANSGADFAIVDTSAAPFADDLVINKPDLSNRPIRLIGRLVTPGDVESLCGAGESLLFVEQDMMTPIKRAINSQIVPDTAHTDELKQAALRGGCVID